MLRLNSLPWQALKSQQSLKPVQRFPSTAVPPSHWCVTREDLSVFEREVRELWLAGGIPDDPDSPNKFHDDPEVGPNIYQVNKFYIKPTTARAGGTSWALMRNPGGLRCDVFVTHAWAEGAFEFCGKVRQMWPRTAKHLYCCFLSNPQNGNVASMLGATPEESPFAAALFAASHVLVVPNRGVSIYTRLWCVYEANLALNRCLEIQMPARPSKMGLTSFTAFWMLVFASAFYIGRHLGPQRSPLVLLGKEGFQIEVVVVTSSIWIRCGPLDSKLMAFAYVCYVGFVTGMVLASGCGLYRLGFIIPVLGDLFYQNFVLVSHETIMAEGQQLSFDTVSSARCSEEVDEILIREAIRGSESRIDEAIDVLKVVGRYDWKVRDNLARGLSAPRISAGVRCGFAATWAGYLALNPLSWFFEFPWWMPMAALASSSLAIGLGTYLCRDILIFPCDSVIMGGLAIHVVGMVSGVVVNGHIWVEESKLGYLSNRGFPVCLDCSLFITVVAAVVTANVCFFSGRCARRRPRLHFLARRSGSSSRSSRSRSSSGSSSSSSSSSSENDLD